MRSLKCVGNPGDSAGLPPTPSFHGFLFMSAGVSFALPGHSAQSTRDSSGNLNSHRQLSLAFCHHQALWGTRLTLPLWGGHQSAHFSAGSLQRGWRTCLEEPAFSPLSWLALPLYPTSPSWEVPHYPMYFKSKRTRDFFFKKKNLLSNN